MGPIGSSPGSVPAPSVAPSPLAVDSEGIWEATALLPEQLAWAIAQARVVGPLPSATQFRHVAVAGMGASGIAGDVLAAYCAPLADTIDQCVSSEHLRLEKHQHGFRRWADVEDRPDSH